MANLIRLAAPFPVFRLGEFSGSNTECDFCEGVEELFDLDGEQAVKLFNDAVEAATEAGLPWMADELVLQPSPQLVELVQKSQQLATGSTEGD